MEQLNRFSKSKTNGESIPAEPTEKPTTNVPCGSHI